MSADRIAAAPEPLNGTPPAAWRSAEQQSSEQWGLQATSGASAAPATTAPTASQRHPLIERALGNPVFAGGAGIATLAAVAGLARSGALAGMGLLYRYYTTSLEIPSRDVTYRWVLPFVNSHTVRAQHLGVSTTVKNISQSSQQPSHHLQSILTTGAASTSDGSSQVETEFEFVPSTGSHWMWYRKQLIHVERRREQGMVDLATGQPYELLQLRTFGSSRRVFEQLLAEARDVAAAKTEGKTLLYTPMGLQWQPFGNPRVSRPITSVVLDKGIAETLTSDLSDFTQSRKWYESRGIPYRRGYLLYGPPGCGKSSFIAALAGHLKYNICLLNLNERGLTDDRLAALLSVVPPRSFVLLEDIDAALPSVRPGSQPDQRQSYSVTFSGLLNVLDGVASGEERVVFMTTNHRDRLDPALIRPGRVDLQQYIGMASHHQCKMMFIKFYATQQPAQATGTQPAAIKAAQGNVAPDANASDLVQQAEQFATIITSSGAQLSAAELQAYFLIHKDNGQLALQNAPHLVAEALQRQQDLKELFGADAEKYQRESSSHTASVGSAARL